MKNKKERIEIGCYTKMSEMKGINSVTEYIDEAIKREWRAIGINDFNSTQSFYTAEKYIIENKIKNLKIIYGVKTKFSNDEDLKNSYDITILVKEQVGLKNLYKIVSKTLTNSEHVIFKSDLDKYREGLLFGATGGEKSEIYKSLLYNERDIYEKVKYYDFLEIEPLYNVTEGTNTNKITDKTKKAKEINEKIIELGNKNNILVVATSNPLFINKEDSICNEILRYSQNLEDIKYDNRRFLHTTEEMLDEFKYIKDKNMVYNIVIENTNKLADICDNIKIEPPRAEYPKITNSKEFIKEKCYKKANELYGEKLPSNIKERLDIELNSILENNFEFMYLLASEMVEKSEELGYLVGNRGSVGNSFVAYLLGITEYNPVEYNLPFEMFAGIKLDKEPCIDLCFSDEVRDKIQDYIEKKFGKDKVIVCGTVSKISIITAYKMVKKYVEDFEIDIDDKKIEELANKLCEIKRGTKKHPGAVFILPEDKKITDFCPIEMDKSNKIKTHIDYHEFSSDNTLYKISILENNELTILNKLQKATKINPKEIDLTDKETLELFLHAGDKKYNSTKGIVGFDTAFMINMLKQVKPQNFNDLVCMSCLSHGTNVWIDNAEKLIKNNNIKVDEVISNRGDIMNYLIKSGINREKAYEITEFIRKGKTAEAKNDIFENTSDITKIKCLKIWEKYRKILEKHNIPEWYIESCEKIKYVFPKAHAIGYTINEFRVAWYKVHYPKEFYKVYFEINDCTDINS